MDKKNTTTLLRNSVDQQHAKKLGGYHNRTAAVSGNHQNLRYNNEPIADSGEVLFESNEPASNDTSMVNLPTMLPVTGSVTP